MGETISIRLHRPILSSPNQFVKVQQLPWPKDKDSEASRHHCWILWIDDKEAFHEIETRPCALLLTLCTGIIKLHQNYSTALCWPDEKYWKTFVFVTLRLLNMFGVSRTRGNSYKMAMAQRPWRSDDLRAVPNKVHHSHYPWKEIIQHGILSFCVGKPNDSLCNVNIQLAVENHENHSVLIGIHHWRWSFGLSVCHRKVHRLESQITLVVDGKLLSSGWLPHPT